VTNPPNSSKSNGPRDFLTNPSDFGTVAARWKPWKPHQNIAVKASYYQHLVIANCRTMHGVEQIQHLTTFALQVKEHALKVAYGPDKGPAKSVPPLTRAEERDMQRLFRGERYARIEDYLAWCGVVGIRVLPNFGDREYLLPVDLIEDPTPKMNRGPRIARIGSERDRKNEHSSGEIADDLYSSD